ncbi:hypothetical protein [Halomonas sp. M20]|uniref:hypothetical protein n=1 Tax=Halomonas sp. M20 TaxID=2763264 RepID=UPI001D0A4F6F|nr:hypothetical protein [Halomonas sp. M20]
MRALIKVEADFHATAPSKYTAWQTVLFDRPSYAGSLKRLTACIDFPRCSFVKSGTARRNGWLSIDALAAAGEGLGKNGYGRYLGELIRKGDFLS